MIAAPQRLAAEAKVVMPLQVVGETVTVVVAAGSMLMVVCPRMMEMVAVGQVEGKQRCQVAWQVTATQLRSTGDDTSARR